MISPHRSSHRRQSEFTLDINNPEEPNSLRGEINRQNMCGTRSEVSRIVEAHQQEGTTQIIRYDQMLPTIYFKGLDNLIAMHKQQGGVFRLPRLGSRL